MRFLRSPFVTLRNLGLIERNGAARADFIDPLIDPGTLEVQEFLDWGIFLAAVLRFGVLTERSERSSQSENADAERRLLSI